MPVAAEASFCVGIDTGISIDMPGAAEAGFLPGVPIVFAVVHGFAVRRYEVEVSFPAEFVEQREFQVVVIGLKTIKDCRFLRIDSPLSFLWTSYFTTSSFNQK